MAKLQPFLVFVAQAKSSQFTVGDKDEVNNKNLKNICVYKFMLSKKRNKSDKIFRNINFKTMYKYLVI